MEYSVSLIGQGTTDMLRSLGDMLLDHDELYGRVRYVEAQPTPGAMGPIVQELYLLLADQDHLQAFGAVLVTWLVSRRRKIKVRLERKDTKAVFAVTSADRDTEAAVRDLMARLAADQVDNPGPAPDG